MNKKLLNEEATKQTLLLAQDLSYARKLAENNEKTRRRSLKLLKQYLEGRSKANVITEEGLQVLWKGLFYSMWMSDKPLVQEKCAENISRLIHCFEQDDAMRFFKFGLLTFANEWIGIDQLRLDKFLMFLRRLLRHALVVLKKSNFKKQQNEKFAVALEHSVLSTADRAPLGLFMHFTEIYLEELAKVACGNLHPSRVVDLLRPYIGVLAFIDESRVTTWVNKFIFIHLMKQHKLGMEYEEKYAIWKQNGFVGSINQVQKISNPDNEEGEEEVSNIDEEDKPLDPRAGRVDVELPPILFKAKDISDAMLELKTYSRTTRNTRNQLQRWSNRFLKLHNGIYPLGVRRIHQCNHEEVDTNVSRAAKRLIKFEQELLADRKRKLDEMERRTKKPKNNTTININDGWDKSFISEEDFCFKRNSGIWYVTKQEKEDAILDTCGSQASFIETIINGSKLLKGKKSEKKKRAVEKTPVRKRAVNGSPKKVVINTKLNVSQEMVDHVKQVISSPLVPWDSSKKPLKPVLKTPTRPSLINPFYKMQHLTKH